MGCLLTHCFYDDFILIEPKCTSSSAVTSSEMILKLLGWRFADQGKKYVQFDSSFDALGVSFCIRNLHMGSFVIQNKASRITELTNTINMFLLNKDMTKPHAASLRGRLGFAQGQFLGHDMKPSLSVLSKFCSDSFLSENCIDSIHVNLALQHLLQCLSNMHPRCVSVTDSKIPVLIFTDGACEDKQSHETNTIGLVLIDPLTGARCVMDGFVPKELIDAWHKVVGSQLIGQVELFPIAITKLIFRDLLKGRRCIYFIDNDSARECMIKGFSPSIASLSLVSLFNQCESLAPSYNWFTRVPSFSNPADLPSRGLSQLACETFEASYKGRLEVSPQDVGFLLACLETDSESTQS